MQRIARKDDIPSRYEELKDGPSRVKKRTRSEAILGGTSLNINPEDVSNHYEITINKSRVKVDGSVSSQFSELCTR